VGVILKLKYTVEDKDEHKTYFENTKRNSMKFT